MSINYNLLENIIMLFWDDASNFSKTTTQQKIGKDLFQDVILIDSLEKLNEVLTATTSDEQKFIFFVHLFHNENNRGYDLFRSSKISKHYPDLVTYLISSAPKKKIYGSGNNELDVFTYDSFHEKIGATFKPQTKKEILGKTTKEKVITESFITRLKELPRIDYAIITALYEDEFQEIEKIFDWDQELDIITNTKRYRIGHLKNNPEKRVVAAVPSATGMVDSSIIATQMLDFFQPKYLFMSGVCGGNAFTNFGDIVVAKKVFTFQKGKITDVKNKEGEKIELFDQQGQPIDYDHLYDLDGNQIRVTVEKFEIEHDSIIEIDSLLKDLIEPKFELIMRAINEDLKTFSKVIRIHFDAMACSTMVINKDGYFESHIKVVDRKTVAVEMESYGVVRASKFANDGKTRCLIFKSVMDNTVAKDDQAKKLAAFTSAQFLKHLVYDTILI